MRLTDYRSRVHRRAAVVALIVSCVVGLTTFGFLSGAGADHATPSDNRATVVQGNPTTCAEAGITATNILSGTGDASDANVSGDVSDYEGQNPPGATPFADDATMLNVTLLNQNVVIQGVVVKGGPGANVYSTNVQNMISPFNHGGNVPAISHWFVCYNIGPPPTTAPPTTAPPTTAVGGVAVERPGAPGPGAAPAPGPAARPGAPTAPAPAGAVTAQPRGVTG